MNMTREEAINEIKSWDFLEGKEIEAIHTLIPELAGSEDEMIRRGLIHHLKELREWQVGSMSPIKIKEHYDAWIAYLEKQQDASKAIEAVDRIDKYIDKHLANAHDMKDSNPDKKYYRGWDDALGKMSGILQDVYSGEKQKKPQHAIRVTKSFGDPDGPQFELVDLQKEQKPIKTDFHTAVKNLMNLHKIKNEFTEEDYDFHAKELLELVEQKPQLYWHKIKAYEKLPCRAYIYKFAYEQENNFHGKATINGYLIPNEPVTIGCDTWYLPVEDIKNLPKEDELDTTSPMKTVKQKPWKVGANAYFTPEQNSVQFKNNKLVNIIKGEFEGFRNLLKKTGIDYEPQRSYWEGLARLFDSSAREYVKEQKPAEWSEEDERMRNQLIYDVKYHKKQALTSAKKGKATEAFYNELKRCYDEKIAWLKSLRLQNKIHYWTEEEIEPIIDDYLTGREHYGGMITRLRCLKPKFHWKLSEEQKPKQEVPADTEVLTAKLVNLLKSYRIGEETATGLANRIADTYGTQRYLDGLCDGKKGEWKPSEEQMKALNTLNLYGNLSYVGQQNQLISLYQDLKKLM